MKNFNDRRFIEGLLSQHCEYVYFFADDPNTMWEMHHFNKKRSDQKKSLGLQAILKS